ncbi:putative pentatricopeptide repeat-containing protein [Iris pallida]|uniref:Pentatricopeptide repeat-containing protein n=1 Tax=Iris pallida TaxID=29817 RepID=A0AAX6DQF6_IRIPA|nr:putative pentatricopeptide repeat-containing protein [Iris pallida]
MMILSPSNTSYSQHKKICAPLSTNSSIKLHKVLNLKPKELEPKRSSTTVKAHGLKQLIASKRLAEAKHLYAEERAKGTPVGILLESMLVDALMKSGRSEDAFKVFDHMPERNVVTWTSIVSGCVRNGFREKGLSLFVEMLKSGVVPNDFAFGAALHACSNLSALALGEQVHCLVIRSGFECKSRIGCCLIDFYSRCGLMDEAVRVFDRMSSQDLVGFTSLISGFCRNSMFDSSVEAFARMIRQGLEPNEHTITSVLTACGVLLGEQIHGFMIKTMIDRSVYSSSALIELYSRNQRFDRAKLVFHKLEDKNVVTWSSIISCCLRNERVEDALGLFLEMVCEGVRPNEFTFATAFGACGLCSGKIEVGRQLHCWAIKLDFVLDNRVSNALITMYSRNSEVDELEKIFKRTECRDVVSWCAAISGYFQNGAYEKSIRFLRKMHCKGLTPNEYGFSSALSSCASLALLDQGRLLHCLALKSGCDTDVCTGNALVNMYGKCGRLDDARSAFDFMNTHDDMSWNSLIHVCAHHGHGAKALEVFDQMVANGFMPDHSTFVGVLVACNHIGLVEKAIEYFSIMSDQYGVVPSSSHYACLVDTMGRAGRLSDALRIIENMSFEQDGLMWKTLLGSCRLNGNLELGKLAARKVIELLPHDSANYVLLSNLHSLHGDWEDAEAVRTIMDDRGVKKDAGRSWIELTGAVHTFVARDESHPKSEFIYQRLEELYEVMTDEDYSIDTCFSLDPSLLD